MSVHKDGVSLRQMLDHAREAMDLVQGLSRAGLERDRLRLLAVQQLLQIVADGRAT